MINRIIVLTATVAIAVTVVAQASANNGQAPFSASFTGTIAFAGPLATLHAGSGQATHIGRTADAGSVVLGSANAAGCYATSDTETLTAASGDQLVLQWQDPACPIGPTSFHCGGHWVVVGGTGRFADATGSGSFEAEEDFGPGFSPGTFELTITGTLSY